MSLDGREVVADPHYSNINETGLLLAYEMAGRWLGPMPVTDFIETFLPDTPGLEELPPLTADSFATMFKESYETVRYTPFIKAIEYLMPDFVGVNTSTTPEEVELLKTDVSFYRKDGEDIPTRTDFSKMELWVEFKKGNTDPFQDLPEGASDEPFPFTPETQEAQMTRGRLATYAVAINARQFRHFSFSIFINDKEARFLRWDPAGVIVSAPFNFCNHPDTLATFLWRFAHLSAAERGHDTSVRPIDLSSEIAQRVRKQLKIKDIKTKLFQYDLPGLAGKGHAYGPFPPLPSRSLVGRCTRTLPVLFIQEVPAQDDNVTNQFDPRCPCPSEKLSSFEKEGVVYLKDTWRRLSPDPDKKVMAEHEIYEMLHAKNTPYIPEHVAGGDIPDTSGGTTRTQDFLDAVWRTTHVSGAVTPFQHYRLVLGVVGRSLTKFRSTKELVQAICDAMKAHWHAYDIVKILHRDISVGNIIITIDGRGLLIDWEMGKIIEEVGPGRTGTWQFMSAALLRNPSKIHTLADDLESFIHIIGWLILRYIPSVKFAHEDRAQSMSMFDEATFYRQGPECGGRQKQRALASGQYLPDDFEFKCPTPLSSLLRDLCSPFRTLYSKPPMIHDPSKANKHLKTPQGLLLSQLLVENYNENIERLKSSTWFIDTISTALDEEAWPEDDGADHTVFKPSKGLLTELQEKLRTSSLMSSQEAFSATKGSGRSNKRAAEDPIAEEVIQSRKRLRTT